MRRRRSFLALGLLALPGFALSGTAAAEPPTDACKLIKRAEVKEILGKPVVKVKRLEDESKHAARCTWETRYYQTKKLKKLKAPFTLQLDTQSTESAADALDELRSSAADIDSTVDRVDGLGDEAYTHFSDLFVVSGDTVFQVGLHNFDESKDPSLDADKIARDAAEKALSRLEG